MVFILCSLLGSALSQDSALADPLNVRGLKMHYSDHSALQRRELPTANLFKNEQNGRLTVRLDIGTPPVSQEFVIDTTFSDVSVNARALSDAQYDYNQSSTFVKTTDRFEIPDRNNQEVEGFFGLDKITAYNQAFNTVLTLVDSDTIDPSLGLGLRANEATARHMETDGSVWPTYPNFVESLKNLGLIKRTAYSLWLAGVDTDADSLLLGGVDHSKYEGPLAAMRMVDQHSVKYHTEARKISVLIDQIGGAATSRGKSFKADMNQPVELDTSSDATRLPEPIANSLAEAFGARYSWESGMFVIDCQTTGKVFFGFSGKFIGIDVKDLMVPGGPFDGPFCTLAVTRGNPGQYTLGAQFLRSVYVVVDLEGHEVAMANAKQGDTGSPNIEELASTGIPRAVRVPNYDHTTYALS